MLLFGESAAGANEVLSRFPAVTDSKGSLNADYLTEITDWAADRFAFRQELITAWSGINSALFKTSVEDKVLIGKNGWLYYSDTLDDYMGRGLEEEKLEAIARNLFLMQDYTESRGVQFLFTIAPNKNSLYPVHMPGYVPDGIETANAKLLMPYLEKYHVRYADLFSPLSCEEEELYFKTDSHWDSKGAALAADVILTELGRDSAYYSSEFREGEAHKGDLYEMLFPAGNYTETDRQIASGFTYTTLKDTNGGNAINIESVSERGTGRLLCWRDSFGVALYPYFAESFHDARFSRSAAYELIRADSEDPDAVIIEIVERNLDYLLEYMALYPAPERELPEVTAQMPALPVSAEQGRTAASSEMTLLQCELPADGDFSIRDAYFVCDGNCFEAAILYPDETGPVASAWISSGETEQISVIYGSETAYYRSDAA